jgi:hypothetical protein
VMPPLGVMGEASIVKFPIRGVTITDSRVRVEVGDQEVEGADCGCLQLRRPVLRVDLEKSLRGGQSIRKES